LGEINLFYDGFFYYDKVIHLVMGFILASLIYGYFINNSTLKKDMVFLAVVGFFGLWELIEFGFDFFTGSQFQGVVRNGVFIMSPLKDTMVDMVYSSLGALLFLIFKREKTKKPKIKRPLLKDSIKEVFSWKNL